MLAFHLLNYTITFDPLYAIEFLNDMWTREPVASLGICISVVSIVLTLSLKLFDLLWDLQKERLRQGKLKIELESLLSPAGQPTLVAVLSNTGREPIVIRDIGYAKPRLFGKEFIAVQTPESPLPHALNARAMVRVPVTDDADELGSLLESFRVKDSLGKIWEAPDAELKRARRHLRQIKHTRAAQTQKQAVLQNLQAAPPLTTQN